MLFFFHYFHVSLSISQILVNSTFCLSKFNLILKFNDRFFRVYFSIKNGTKEYFSCFPNYQSIYCYKKLFFWVNRIKNMFTFFHNFGNTWIASGKLIKIWFLVVKQTGYEVKETPQLRQLNVDMPSCSVWYLQDIKVGEENFQKFIKPMHSLQEYFRT